MEETREMTKGVPVVVLSGLGGSGKTTALRALEDIGFYCVDNLPVPLLPTFLELTRGRPAIRGVRPGH